MTSKQPLRLICHKICQVPASSDLCCHPSPMNATIEMARSTLNLDLDPSPWVHLWQMVRFYYEHDDQFRQSCDIFALALITFLVLQRWTSKTRRDFEALESRLDALKVDIREHKMDLCGFPNFLSVQGRVARKLDYQTINESCGPLSSVNK
ncbi:hypothetical protein pipiens_003892 [Culex pipiens pipiens]|uniref:Uncharacterized protein n=1 Tax=Culex pipiens pipiens TaxID=38569 RepID=A0ABD1CRA6_CULPP